MAKLTAAQRQEQITQLLQERGTMRTVDLAEYFNVSRETIRKDLVALSEAGAIKKWFGSVMPVNDFSIPTVDAREKQEPEAKRAIAKKALEYLPAGSVIYLDTGSTTLEVARQLSHCSGYTIVTNSLPVAMELIDSPNELILTGGTVNSKVRSTTGMQTIEFLETLKIDVAVLGSSGFDQHEGPTVNSFEDSHVKRVALKNARTSIVAADSSKAAYSSLSQYAPWRNIDYLITDSNMPADTMRSLDEMTDVIIADDDKMDAKGLENHQKECV